MRGSARLGMIALWTVMALAGAGLLALSSPTAQEDRPGVAYRLVVDGPIGPATGDFIRSGLNQAAIDGAGMVIVEMNTPGGLVDSTRDIISAILSSPVPVATHVAPSGSRAASAGTYILLASSVAAMAPDTTVGAATPVQMGGGTPLPGMDEDDLEDLEDNGENSENGDSGQNGDNGQNDDNGADGVNGDNGDEAEQDADQDQRSGGETRDAAEAKAINDAIAYIRSLAERHDRNADWAERAVREAATLTANGALEQNVIDFIARDARDLLEQADGMTVNVAGDDRTLETANLVVEDIEPTFANQLLSILTNPNVAFLLMLIGVYGIIFELANPGALVPGVIGVTSLLLGLYALNVLPINYAGLALIMLGLAFMIAEVFMPSFGIMGIGGAVAFLLGATMLIDTDVPGFELSWPVIVGSTVVTVGLMVFLLGYVIRAHRKPIMTGQEHLAKREARVISWMGRTGYVHMEGERWSARLEGDGDLAPDDRVLVKAIDGLTLVVTVPDTTTEKKDQ